jgi:hypothetical protein
MIEPILGSKNLTKYTQLELPIPTIASLLNKAFDF